MSKILHLTLKKKWFDMIASGEKKEEYRDIKPYWEKRLFYNGDSGQPKKFDVIEFKNGYSKSARIIHVKCNGIWKGKGNIPNWGCEPGKEYYVIWLGEIIRDPNY